MCHTLVYEWHVLYPRSSTSLIHFTLQKTRKWRPWMCTNRSESFCAPSVYLRHIGAFFQALNFFWKGTSSVGSFTAFKWSWQMLHTIYFHLSGMILILVRCFNFSMCIIFRTWWMNSHTSCNAVEAWSYFFKKWLCTRDSVEIWKTQSAIGIY